MYENRALNRVGTMYFLICCTKSRTYVIFHCYNAFVTNLVIKSSKKVKNVEHNRVKLQFLFTELLPCYMYN